MMCITADSPKMAWFCLNYFGCESSTYWAAAGFCLIDVGVFGFIAAVGQVADYYKPKSACLLYGLVLMVGLTPAVMSWRLGVSGGEIRHTEIRSGPVANTSIEPTEDDD